ncbi:DUF1707 domain-containing protein [Actinomycetospora sp.]|uniref:DUF1707 SHOCT-like domain-containing protein n=1 Tax=Actinomycetospora sp. TaxID=1872135 RepID=UPI002F423CE9
MRASDAERGDAVRLLQHALGEGRLDLQETETRVAAAYASVHLIAISRRTGRGVRLVRRSCSFS